MTTAGKLGPIDIALDILIWIAIIAAVVYGVRWLMRRRNDG